jgi:transposase
LWLAEDKVRPRKQRHTAKRVLERLRDERGFDDGSTIFKDYVRAKKRSSKEMFVPLTRQRTQRFSEMLSQYVVRDRYGCPGKGDDKGAVEGLISYARRNLMVPIPSFSDVGGVQRPPRRAMPQTAGRYPARPQGQHRQTAASRSGSNAGFARRALRGLRSVK